MAARRSTAGTVNSSPDRTDSFRKVTVPAPSLARGRRRERRSAFDSLSSRWSPTHGRSPTRGEHTSVGLSRNGVLTHQRGGRPLIGSAKRPDDRATASAMINKSVRSRICTWRARATFHSRSAAHHRSRKDSALSCSGGRRANYCRSLRPLTPRTIVDAAILRTQLAADGFGGIAKHETDLGGDATVGIQDSDGHARSATVECVRDARSSLVRRVRGEETDLRQRLTRAAILVACRVALARAYFSVARVVDVL